MFFVLSFSLKQTNKQTKKSHKQNKPVNHHSWALSSQSSQHTAAAFKQVKAEMKFHLSVITLLLRLSVFQMLRLVLMPWGSLTKAPPPFSPLKFQKLQVAGTIFKVLLLYAYPARNYSRSFQVPLFTFIFIGMSCFPFPLEPPSSTNIC